MYLRTALECDDQGDERCGEYLENIRFRRSRGCFGAPVLLGAVLRPTWEALCALGSVFACLAIGSALSAVSWDQRVLVGQYIVTWFTLRAVSQLLVRTGSAYVTVTILHGGCKVALGTLVAAQNAVSACRSFLFGQEAETILGKHLAVLAAACGRELVEQDTAGLAEHASGARIALPDAVVSLQFS